MPIIIDEVVITVEVENQGAAAPVSAPGAARGESVAADKQTLVAECVERVLDILAERKEP